MATHLLYNQVILPICINSLTSVAITVKFSQQMFMYKEESEQARPSLIFSNPSSFNITIQVMVTDNTAVGVNNGGCIDVSSENDYEMGLYNVTFKAMVTESVIDIAICNDIVLEDNETFSLSIISNSLHDNVTSDSPNQATVTIIDNDRKSIQLSIYSNFSYNNCCLFFSNHYQFQPIHVSC